LSRAVYWPWLWPKPETGVIVPDADGVDRADICDMRCCSHPSETTRGDCVGVDAPEVPRRREGVMGEKKARRPDEGWPVADPAHDAAADPEAPDADAAASSRAAAADDDAESSVGP
jgi:hypothetical protein